MSSPKYMKAFGKRLTAARIAAGYETAEQFSKLLGVKPHTYRKYERGETSPSYELLLELSERLDKPLDYLLGRTT